MIAKDIISREIPALSVSQTGRDAFYLLGEHHVRHLPVVRDGKLLGVISEEDVFNHKVYDPIGQYDFSLIRRYSVHAQDHLFEIVRVMADNRLTTIPVVEDDDTYVGLISQNGLLRAMSQTAAFAEAGAIIVLEMHRRDYNLSLISRLVEEEEAKILGAFVSSTQDSETLELTLKLNRQETSRVIAGLERHGYAIQRMFTETDADDNLLDRYESLMNYLNV